MDRWEKDYYEVISQKSSGIPVFVIKSLGKDGRERTLHRNMLYPLSFQIRGESEQQQSEQHLDVDHESLVEDQSGSVDNSLEEQPVQKGPITHSCTQALMKANLLMSEHFDIDSE